ncbi:hypothetical protein BD560DRAFT_389234 [Blakeslea trispora]|nr:hypothetical protein BD560DRAFT_389234 [Blakeslea trispora]
MKLNCLIKQPCFSNKSFMAVVNQDDKKEKKYLFSIFSIDSLKLHQIISNELLPFIYQGLVSTGTFFEIIYH